MGSVIAYELLRKRAAAGTLNFYPASVRNLHFEGATPVLTVGLSVLNTSNQQFTLRSLAGNVLDNGYGVGTVEDFTATPIGPNGKTTIYLNLRLNILGIVNDIVTAATTGDITQKLQLKGYANVDGNQVPININYQVG